MFAALKWLFVFWRIRRDQRTRRLLAGVQDLSWPQRTSLIAGLARDRRLPWRVRVVPFLLAAYIASPLDFIPDFIPVLGQLDDIAAIKWTIGYIQRTLPPGLLEEHLDRVNGVNGAAAQP